MKNLYLLYITLMTLITVSLATTASASTITYTYTGTWNHISGDGFNSNYTLNLHFEYLYDTTDVTYNKSHFKYAELTSMGSYDYTFMPDADRFIWQANFQTDGDGHFLKGQFFAELGDAPNTTGIANMKLELGPWDQPDLQAQIDNRPIDIVGLASDSVITLDTGWIVTEPVPEPATMLLFGLGLLGLAGVNRRKQ